ncbi:response regulator [Ruminococcus sp. 2227st1_E6_2227SCRN_220401]|uniref:response regulator n=1 Tax=unclassified Ruminococcus TaxID=2608920 RepID=UPI00319E73B7
MLRILVVDDEPKVRRGVSGLIRMYPEKYEMIGCCACAKEAIEILGKSVPDVILTDIRMPDQDGLELIDYLKHRYQNLDFIILSGYDDFEYARKALQFQVYDFLLKPLKPEELFCALDGVAEKRNSSHITESQSIEDNYFFNLIRSETKDEEEKNRDFLGLSKDKEKYCVALLDARMNCEEFTRKYGSLAYAVKEYLPRAEKTYTCFGYQLILVWKDPYSDDFLEEVIQKLENTFGCRFYLGISRWKEDYHQIKEAYFEALDAVKQYIYFKEQKVSRADRLEQKKMVFPSLLCEKVMNAIRSGNTEQVKQSLQLFFEEYKEKRCTICCLKQHLRRFSRNIESVAEEIGMDGTCSNSIQAFLRNMEEIEDFSEMERVFMNQLERMAKVASEVTEWKMNSYYLKQILDFVQDHFDQPISLEDVAGHVNLSVGYLSNYFKEKMGMPFTDYLLKLRMEKAKELLAHTNEKIYRIAERTGYQNSQYFVTVFKKNTGVTPAEYRKYLKK